MIGDTATEIPRDIHFVKPDKKIKLLMAPFALFYLNRAIPGFNPLLLNLVMLPTDANDL